MHKFRKHEGEDRNSDWLRCEYTWIQWQQYMHIYAFVCLFIYSTWLQCDNWRLFLPPCAGSNCGIGKATALGLARRGARVILACRHQGAAEAAAYDIRRVRDTPASHHGPLTTHWLPSAYIWCLTDPSCLSIPLSLKYCKCWLKWA